MLLYMSYCILLKKIIMNILESWWNSIVQSGNNITVLWIKSLTIIKCVKNLEKSRFFYWEQRKLENEVTDIIAGGDIDKNNSVEKGKYPIYANALVNDGIVGFYNDYFRVKAPAVTVTGRGEIGHAVARDLDFTPVVRLLSLKSNHYNHFFS